MRHSPGPLPRRAMVGRSALVALRTAGGGPANVDGDRGSTGDPLGPRADDGEPTAPGDAAGPPDDVLGSSITEPGNTPAERVPRCSNTPGYDADVLGLDTEFRFGGDQLTVQLVSQRDAAWVGALFAAVDAQR
ncbi:hypothetical protein ACFVTC_09205 [Streptomyces sp. NPDC057950]|uniref:hypothetical protein n=1 Tax=Streptomyces sp. NPDC057950 TaxID=3346288 RepID=UPI0036E54F82